MYTKFTLFFFVWILVILIIYLFCREIAVHIAPYSLDFGLVLIGGKLAKDEPAEDHLK